MNKLTSKLSSALLATALLAAACSGDGADSGSSTTQPDQLVIDLDGAIPIGNLRPFAACEELRDYFTTNVISMIDEGWFSQGGYYLDDDVMVLESGAATTAAMAMDSSDQDFAAEAPAAEGGESAGRLASDDSAGGDPNFSGTNNQEQGVDEPDLVKTNGEIMVTVTGQTLAVFDVRGGGLELLGELMLQSWSRDMLLVGDRVLVMGEEPFEFYYEEQYFEGVAATTAAPDSDVEEGFAREESVADSSPSGRIGPPPFIDQWKPRSALTEIDISDPANPTMLRRLVVDGSYLSAREVGGVVRIVMRTSPQNIYPQYWDGEKELSQEDAIAALRSNIRDTDLDYWLPSYSLIDSATDEILAEGSLLNCTDVSRPETFSGYETLSVLTVDMTEGLQPPTSSVAVIAGGDLVYASTDSLYVATGQWWRWNVGFFPGSEDVAAEMTTEIHKFDISSSTQTEYVGSGAVGGFLLNQFAMSEFEGDLRVATTTSANGWWCCDRGGEESESFVAVLRPSDGRLEQIGEVGGLGLGETIRSVRFIGDVGYVVTFRQTDPLYVVDLSDPTNPAVTGELKINGFSAYLHPLGDGLLLGVGQDATDEGFTTGTQVSIFDVSDPTNPTRVQQYNFPDGFSNAEWDSHAFLYWAADNMLVLPLQIFAWDGPSGSEDFFTGAVVLNIDGANEITERGRVSQPLVIPEWYAEELKYIEEEAIEIDGDIIGDFPDIAYFQPQIERSVVVDGTLYTISLGGVMASDMTSLVRTGWVELDGAF